jgi:thymidylate synthase (FAD)
MHTAKLVSVTPDAEKNIVYMARVSNPANQANEETAPRLIRYLIRHRHWSPFEMASMQVEIETTRSIAAQILRHRSASYQEFSQRYSDVTVLPDIPVPILRRQDTTNKQASHDDLPDDVVEDFNSRISAHFANANALYRDMLESGIAKECARDVLPLATPTRLYMSATIRTFIHYIEVRAGIETQLEHRLIAESIKEIFKTEFPAISDAMGWLAP